MLMVLAIDDTYICIKCCTAHNNFNSNTECMPTLIMPYIQDNKEWKCNRLKKAIKHNIPTDKQYSYTIKCMCPG